MTQPWLIKQRELGSSRVLGYCDSREDAIREVERLSEQYQSDQYYAEPYNSKEAQR